MAGGGRLLGAKKKKKTEGTASSVWGLPPDALKMTLEVALDRLIDASDHL